jgi:anti-sigma factor RsiW
MPCPDSLRLQAYFDGGVDALSAADTERHVETCAECAALLRDLERIRATLRHERSYFRASPALRMRISAALDEETAGRTSKRQDHTRASWRARAFWLGAISGIGASALAAALAFLLLVPLFAHSLVDDLAAAHIRSLMPTHLIDVASTDKHTVKPWFAGHTDISPLVADFAPQGYRLIGGRADYLQQQRAAVVVYQHGSHVINVFSWSGHRVLPRDATRNGYHLVFWRAQDIEYCAVSDVAWDELLGLARLMQDVSRRELHQ